MSQVWEDFKGKQITIADIEREYFTCSTEGPRNFVMRFPWDLIQPAQSNADPISDLLRTPTPRPAAPVRRLHEFVVGDRFACNDSTTTVEVAEIVNRGIIKMRSREVDGVKFTTTQNVLCDRCVVRYDLTHISGPTFKALVKAPIKPCNCHAQITGSRVHAAYCNLEGGL